VNFASTTVILGVDPGTQVTGYGVLSVNGKRLEPVDFGCIRQKKGMEMAQKYLTIFNAICQLIDRYNPTAVAVETQYVKKNIQSAIKLGMARCAVVLASAKKNVPIFEYPPTKAKLAVVGNGSASKYEVQRMVQMLLGLKELPQPEDAADALAIALCHANHSSFTNLLAKSLL
jgi:crossover junction endodeoxyribonuclease RuvC